VKNTSSGLPVEVFLPDDDQSVQVTSPYKSCRAKLGTTGSPRASMKFKKPRSQGSMRRDEGDPDVEDEATTAWQSSLVRKPIKGAKQMSTILKVS
jgi:hypothetical protein